MTRVPGFFEKGPSYMDRPEKENFHKLNPFVCHRRKPTPFRWWEKPWESLDND